jgi:S1-C subfamily serine protease
MRKNISIAILWLFAIQVSFSQNNNPKIYFDKSGRATDQEQPRYYYRQQVDGNNYKSYYVNGNALYFEGKILNAHNDESLNTYTGICTWYFKNGNKKIVRNFDAAGIENGTSFYYYESGKIWKEIEYTNGQVVGGRYKEYNEDGQYSRIFEEDFNNNNNDWDLYVSDKTSAKINKGSLELISYVNDGTARYISLPSNSAEFTIEAEINLEKLKEGSKTGLIFGFKDWQNYNYFLITSSSFYIGLVYEGVSSVITNNTFTSDIKKKTVNNIKIISNGQKNIYSINGEIQYTCERTRNFGSNVGFVVSGKSAIDVNKFIYKEIDFKSSGITTSNADLDVKASGSGLIFSKSGYVLTNQHVIDGSDKILVEVNMAGVSKTYNAKLVQKDEDNDLAILKIEDDAFKPLNALPYAFKESGGVDVGASVFTIGYPYALSGMGKEAKFTDGKISSKTGYNNAINTYQTSIPVQPGNSGGPLFNDKGQLIGVVNAKVKGADNVSYAIKLNYVKNLIELLPDAVELPNNQGINTLSLEEKIKVLSDYVVLIKIK